MEGHKFPFVYHPDLRNKKVNAETLLIDKGIKSVHGLTSHDTFVLFWTGVSLF